jgi:cell division septation protein DedD
MKRIVYFIAVSSVLAFVASAQSGNVDAYIAARVRMVEEGRAGQVKTELPELVSKYQNHPGVLYIQGLLAANGAEAAKYYQMVLDNFPRSEWADDALYRIYLYYYSLGLARTAELKMQQLRKDYPNSPYARKTRLTEQMPPDERKDEVKKDEMKLEPPPMPSPTPPPVTPGGMGYTEGAYAIQVGAFASIENAMRLKSFFEELGYPVEVQNKVRGGRSLHLVWVGSFSTPDEARRFGAEVKAKHKIESIVVLR